MSFFTPQTTRVAIDKDHAVIVRKLSFGELSDATSASMIPDPNSGRITIDPIRMQKEIYARAVMEWFGPNFEDRPVTRANVLALPTHVAKAIREASEELNKEIEAEEGNESAAPSSS